MAVICRKRNASVTAFHPRFLSHILPGRCGHRPLRPFIEQTLSEFHTSNIQRARTKRLARRIVRLGNPILKPPEGRSLRGAPSVNGTQNQNAFSGATALFRSPASLFCILFSDKPEKSMPPEASRAIRRKIKNRRNASGGLCFLTAPDKRPASRRYTSAASARRGYSPRRSA